MVRDSEGEESQRVRRGLGPIKQGSLGWSKLNIMLNIMRNATGALGGQVLSGHQ